MIPTEEVRPAALGAGSASANTTHPNCSQVEAPCWDVLLTNALSGAQESYHA